MNTLTLWLTYLSDYIVYDLLNLTPDVWYSNALHYFIIGISEITILSVLVIYLMNVLTSYLSMDKIRLYLSKHKTLGIGNVLASLLGAITPFCSCSSIPLFIGMMQSKIPLGIAFSFLITSPLINEIAIAMFMVIFGWKITVTYILVGLALGILGGIVIDKLGMSRYIADWIVKLPEAQVANNSNKIEFKERVANIHQQSWSTIKKIIPYIFIGLSIGAFIHGYVPADFVQEYFSKENIFAVPIAVIMSVPLYIDAVSVLPVIDTLIEKGIPIGTALAFMMGSIGLSLPEALLLKKVVKNKLLAFYFSFIAVGMIFSGYLLNILF